MSGLVVKLTLVALNSGPVLQVLLCLFPQKLYLPLSVSSLVSSVTRTTPRTNPPRVHGGDFWDFLWKFLIS